MSYSKIRLDCALSEKNNFSRQRAKALIMAGKVIVNGRPADKAGTLVSKDDNIVLKQNNMPYVSRGGLKLEAALEAFCIDVKGFLCIDVGASSGGFTDCMLQRGAKKIFALDVGYGQIAWKLRQDPRVVVIERTNIRYANKELIPVSLDLATIDVSFISLKKVLLPCLKFLNNKSIITALVKPQFEVGKGKVGKGGIVKDPSLHLEVIEDIKKFSIEVGLKYIGFIESPIYGQKGNKEFLICMQKAA